MTGGSIPSVPVKSSNRPKEASFCVLVVA